MVLHFRISLNLCCILLVPSHFLPTHWVPDQQYQQHQQPVSQSDVGYHVGYQWINAPTGKTSQAWFDQLGERETGYPNGNPQQYKVRDELGFVGKYKFGESILKELGYYDPPLDDYGVPYYYLGDPSQPPYKNLWQGRWIGKAGIDSLDEFLDSPQAQEQAIREAMRLYWHQIIAILSRSGTSIETRLDQDTQTLGLSSRRIRLTRSGILAGAHLRGARAIADFLLRGQDDSDERGTSILDYLDEFGGYDLEDAEYLYQR
jgi:hypothetical protein